MLIVRLHLHPKLLKQHQQLLQRRFWSKSLLLPTLSPNKGMLLLLWEGLRERRVCSLGGFSDVFRLRSFFNFPRYVAEVSASAMAVEQLEREGRLDLQRNSTEVVEGWGEEEEDEVEETVQNGDGDGEEQTLENREEMVQEVQGAADEMVAPGGTCDTETVKTEDGKCNNSSGTSHDGGEEELERLMDSSVLSQRLHESGSLHPPERAARTNNPSLLAEMRTSLVEAQEEATSLLRQIQGEEEGGSSEH